MAHDKTQKHYDDLAAMYDRRYADYLEHTHQRFLTDVLIKADDRILDLSCGTGLLAEKMLAKNGNFNKLVLNDFSQKMLQKARERLKSNNRITFTDYSAQKLSFADNSFSKIFCLNSFHYYQDQTKVLAECRRVLKDSGELYILDWNKIGWFKLVNLLINMGGSEHINTRSASEARNMLQNIGFRIQENKEWSYKWWKFYYLVTQYNRS